MIWLTWRQFRAQALATLVILAAAVIYFLITGLQMHHSYALDLAGCTPQNDCANVLNDLQQHYNVAFNLTQVLVVAAPALIGIFWGAPLVARELETGTNQLAWNQSVTRTRWLAVKLAGVGSASVAAAALLSLLVTWWAGPLDYIAGSRFSGITFSSRDVVPLAYAAFAFTLGVTVGLVMRRTVPAMAVTLAVFVGIQILVPTIIRPNLLSSTTVSFPINRAIASQATGIYSNDGSSDFNIVLPVPLGAWVIAAPPVANASGHVAASAGINNCLMPPPSGPGKTGGPSIEKVIDCLAKYDLHEGVTYQPASHYWPLQWYESGIFLLLAAALSGSCFWLIRRRRN